MVDNPNWPKSIRVARVPGALQEFTSGTLGGTGEAPIRKPGNRVHGKSVVPGQAEPDGFLLRTGASKKQGPELRALLKRFIRRDFIFFRSATINTGHRSGHHFRRFDRVRRHDFHRYGSVPGLPRSGNLRAVDHRHRIR